MNRRRKAGRLEKIEQILRPLRQSRSKHVTAVRELGRHLAAVHAVRVQFRDWPGAAQRRQRAALWDQPKLRRGTSAGLDENHVRARPGIDRAAAVFAFEIDEFIVSTMQA